MKLAREAKLEPWHIVEEGAGGKLEVCVFLDGVEAELVSTVTTGNVVRDGPTSIYFQGLLRVRPDDLRRLVDARGSGIEIKSLRPLREQPGTPDAAWTSPIRTEWELTCPLSVTLGSLHVRAVEWEARTTEVADKPKRELRSDARRRREVVLGALIKVLADDRLKYRHDTTGKPNIQAVVDAVASRIDSDVGSRDGFSDKAIRGHLEDCLQKLTREKGAGDSAGR